ncbi:Aste57867_20916 [Aphanomyces stellatus]|uniref:Aste57867_20916 protein n=1 Tax=Aphanomyces stellatus TaxID=120398 RepID=A0A485LG49_9STRA|nr:hypothetical protein As57867_020848 [Aphanomyces stellatus]VFT97593.1 Aste57867_20916 [Aphanomyces stellatus]
MLAWEEVAIQLGRSPSFKINKKASALKTRFETIMNKFKAGEASSKRKSGTVEEYEEREQLLTDMRSLMRDHEESSDARRDVKKRKAEGIESSGVLMRRMAIAEVTTQGDEAEGGDIVRKKKPAAPRVDVGGLLEVIQSGIDEKRRRDDAMIEMMKERLDFDRAQADRQAQHHADQQCLMLELVGAILKKT